MTARTNGVVRPAPASVSPASSVPDFTDNVYDGVAGVRRDAAPVADTAVVLSHLWSRPTADEFQVWLQWRDSADHLFRQVCESDEYAWDELDVPELLAVLDAAPRPEPRLPAAPLPGGGVEYRPDDPDAGFGLAWIERDAVLPLAGPAIALCLDGVFDVTGERSSARLARGDAVLASPDEGTLRIAGAGLLVVAR